VTVTKLAAAHDVGKAINPARVRGQIEGGAVQGLGFALSEDYTLAEGIPQQRDIESYRLPTAEIVPEFETILIESESGKGPYGAKGIGEPAITATAPAILNALSDAIGTRITDLPADPETVFDALTDGE
jgi:CO/xanthine dehydrogenase Mo-binding subunit